MPVIHLTDVLKDTKPADPFTLEFVGPRGDVVSFTVLADKPAWLPVMLDEQMEIAREYYAAIDANDAERARELGKQVRKAEQDLRHLLFGAETIQALYQAGISDKQLLRIERYILGPAIYREISAEPIPETEGADSPPDPAETPADPPPASPSPATGKRSKPTSSGTTKPTSPSTSGT